MKRAQRAQALQTQRCLRRDHRVRSPPRLPARSLAIRGFSVPMTHPVARGVASDLRRRCGRRRFRSRLLKCSLLYRPGRTALGRHGTSGGRRLCLRADSCRRTRRPRSRGGRRNRTHRRRKRRRSRYSVQSRHRSGTRRFRRTQSHSRRRCHTSRHRLIRPRSPHRSSSSSTSWHRAASKLPAEVGRDARAATRGAAAAAQACAMRSRTPPRPQPRRRHLRTAPVEPESRHTCR